MHACAQDKALARWKTFMDKYGVPATTPEHLRVGPSMHSGSGSSPVSRSAISAYFRCSSCG
jgi:hypothetical protein